MGDPIVDYTLADGQLLSQTQGTTTNYFLPDAQGSVRALANSSGTITDTYDYTAFGDLYASTGSATNSYLYTGQQFDDATGLYSLRARYYGPTIGRFLSMDTFPVNYHNPIELNHYGYAANNPINRLDPSGLSFVESAQRFIQSDAGGRTIGGGVGGAVFGGLGSFYLYTASMTNQCGSDMRDFFAQHIDGATFVGVSTGAGFIFGAAAGWGADKVFAPYIPIAGVAASGLEGYAYSLSAGGAFTSCSLLATVFGMTSGTGLVGPGISGPGSGATAVLGVPVVGTLQASSVGGTLGIWAGLLAAYHDGDDEDDEYYGGQGNGQNEDGPTAGGGQGDGANTGGGSSSGSNSAAGTGGTVGDDTSTGSAGNSGQGSGNTSTGSGTTGGGIGYVSDGENVGVFDPDPNEPATTVIGRMSDVARFEDNPQIDTWWKSGRIPDKTKSPPDPDITWQENEAWLIERVWRGDNFGIATNPNDLPRTVLPAGSDLSNLPDGYFTARELDWLRRHGIEPVRMYD